jgi:hypothetical protein
VTSDRGVRRATSPSTFPLELLAPGAGGGDRLRGGAAYPRPGPPCLDRRRRRCSAWARARARRSTPVAVLVAFLILHLLHVAGRSAFGYFSIWKLGPQVDRLSERANPKDTKPASYQIYISGG